MNESTTEQKPEASPEKLLLAQLHQKLTEAGLSSEATSTYSGGFKVGGTEVVVRHKHHGRFSGPAKLVVQIGASHYNNRRIYSDRGGKGYDWTAILKELRRQVAASITAEEHWKRVRARHDESKRLMDEIVAAHGLAQPSDSMGDVSVTIGEHRYRGPKLDVATEVVVSDGVESRRYKVTLAVDALSPEKLDEVLKTLRPVLVEHKLAKEQGQ